MQKITTFISSFDIYGSLFNFTINRRLIFKTSIGGIISIITFFFVIYTSYLFGKDFFYRTNPKVFMQEVTPNESKRIKITNRNFTLAWRIEDKFKNPVEFPKGLFFPQISHKSYDNIKKNIPIKKCKDIFNVDDIDILVNENIILNSEEWYCIDFDYSEFFLGGTSTNNGFDQFEILLNTCNKFLTENSHLNLENQNVNVTQYDKLLINNNASYKIGNNINLSLQNQNSVQTYISESDKNCGTIINLQNFLSEPKFISILYPKAYYKFTDLKKPFEIIYNKYETNINLNLIKFDEFSLNSEILSDDDSWIFTNLINYMGLSIRDIKTSYYFQDSSVFIDNRNFTKNITFYSFNIILKKDYFQYFRSFMKFQDFAAVVGGFVKIVTLILSFLYDKYNMFSRDKYLIDYLFDNERKLEKLNDEKNLFNINNFRSCQSMNNIFDINSKSYSKINNTNIKDEHQKSARKSYNPNLNRIFDHLTGRVLNSPGNNHRSYSISAKKLRKFSDYENHKNINRRNKIETILINNDNNDNYSPTYNEENLNNLFIENKNNNLTPNLSPNQKINKAGSLNFKNNVSQSHYDHSRNDSVFSKVLTKNANKKNSKNFNEMYYDYNSRQSINYKNFSIDNNVKNLNQELIKNDYNTLSERNKYASKNDLNSKKETQNNIQTSEIFINNNKVENQKHEFNLKKKKHNNNLNFIKNIPINLKSNDKSSPISVESNHRISLDRKISNSSQSNVNNNLKNFSNNLNINSSIVDKNKNLKKFNNYLYPNYETENEIQSGNENKNQKNLIEGENIDFLRLNTKEQNNTFVNLKNFSKSFKLEYSSNRLKSRYSRKTNILKMNFFNYCCIKYFKKNLSREEERKMFIFEYAREYISKKLDLLKYLKNLSYLNLIIELISNSNQKTALKYLSQPCIKTENFDIVKRIGISPTERHNNMIEYFSNVCENESLTIFDSKLLTMLKKKFSNIY